MVGLVGKIKNRVKLDKALLLNQALQNEINLYCKSFGLRIGGLEKFGCCRCKSDSEFV